jgi:hypothetical protein
MGGVDLESARQAIGYEPKDAFPEGLPYEIPAGEPLKVDRPHHHH